MSVIRNGVRIATLSRLSVYVDKSFLFASPDHVEARYSHLSALPFSSPYCCSEKNRTHRYGKGMIAWTAPDGLLSFPLTSTAVA